MLRNALNLALM